jgi:hypothetical protein
MYSISKQFNILGKNCKHKLRVSFTSEILFRNIFRLEKCLAIYSRDAQINESKFAHKMPCFLCFKMNYKILINGI